MGREAERKRLQRVQEAQRGEGASSCKELRQDGQGPSAVCSKQWRAMCDEYINSGLWTTSDKSFPEAWETMAEKREIVRSMRHKELHESDHLSVVDGNARPFMVQSSNLTDGKLDLRSDMHADPTIMNLMIDGDAAWQIAQGNVVANDAQTEEQAAIDAFRLVRAITDIKLGNLELRTKLRLTQIRLRLYKRLGF